jgi:hypothetical protein
MMSEGWSWARFLPKEDHQAFVAELAAARALDDLAAVTQVITAWRHTAEVHADPELLAALCQDSQDLGEVPAPGEPSRD